MYKPTHFSVHELVPEHVYNKWGDKALMFLDDRALMTLDALREKWGPITVNNWFWDGPRQWSGLRTEETHYGSQYSQHRFGRAFDCVFHEIDDEDVRQYILANPDEFPYINSIELGTEGWLHFDVRNCKRIKTYYG